MMNRMVGNALTLAILIFRLFVADAAVAQTYTQMQWGMNKATTPYQFGANINGTWSNLGTISSAGVWTLNPTAVNVTGSFNVVGEKDAASFGLVNDPSCTTDQTSKLQTAINSTGPGGTLHIRGNVTYCITQVSIPYSNFTLRMDPYARLYMTDATKTGITIGTPYSATPYAYTPNVTLDNLQIAPKPGVVMNAGTYALAAYQTINFWLHNGSIGYYDFNDGNIYLYNGVLIDGYSEARIDGIAVGDISHDAFDIIGENAAGTDILFLNGVQIYCDPGRPGTASRNNGSGINVLGGAGGVALQNVTEATCNNGLSLVNTGSLDNREIFLGQQSWFDSNKAYAVYIGPPVSGKVPYGILDCEGCWLSGNVLGALVVSSGQPFTSLIRLQSPIIYTNGTANTDNAILLNSGTMELRGGYIHDSKGNGINVASGATAIIDAPTVDYSGAIGIVGNAGSTIKINSVNFANNTTADFINAGTTGTLAMPALKGTVNGSVCANTDGSLFSSTVICNNALKPFAFTVGALPTCNASTLGSLTIVSNGTDYGTGTYGSAVSATGSVTRFVSCTNTAGPTTYAWAYN